MVDYSTDNNDRLLEHYAQDYATKDGIAIEQARALIDTHPGMQGILGRIASDGDYERARLNAYSLAGIATDEQKARLAEIRAKNDVERAVYQDEMVAVDDEIVDVEIVEPSAIEPAPDWFAGPIDHIDGLMQIRDGILRAEEQAAVLLANGDIDTLAHATADVKVIYDDIGTFIRARRADIAAFLIAKHEAEGGNPRRRPKVEVEGLGVVEVPSGRERKNWRSPELLMRLIAQTIITEEGEAVFTDPIDAATAIYQTLLDCLPVTASLGWRVGSFDKVSETWTGLRGHGIDLDEFSDEVEKDRLAEIPKRAAS